MRASGRPGDPDTASESVTLWSELIDRGGLYHINDKVTPNSNALFVCMLLYMSTLNNAGVPPD